MASLAILTTLLTFDAIHKYLKNLCNKRSENAQSGELANYIVNTSTVYSDSIHIHA